MTNRVTTNHAARLLAAIRIANGSIALLAPGVFARRTGAPSVEAAARYPFRLFGARAILNGCELMWPAGTNQWTHQATVLLHASDLTAAVLAARRGDVSPGFARRTVALSALNTALAVLALARKPEA
jgi:hypothetical protein